jgi:NAD(P)-dependent dehydrogenase (short-subunit alcohol dehydrogenase family)
MSQDNGQKVVLITGANRGIGLEAARQLARRGFHVVVGARDEASGRRAVEELRAEGGEATFLPLDVSNSDSVRTAAPAFAQIAGHLDVLINNAGVYPD